MEQHELEAKVRRIAQELYEVPYEIFSRFSMDSPRCLLPAETGPHLAAGWGLGCAEKTRLFAARLDELGVENRILSGGMEYWINGVNALGQRGPASQPIAEREEKIIPLFTPGRKTHAYEFPPQLSHWGNLFRIGKTRYLVDTTGDFTTLKYLSGKEVDDLLDRRPKSYLIYAPFRLHLFYHEPSQELLELVQRKELEEPRYAVSRLLTNSLYGSPWYLLGLSWWWRQPAMDAAIAATAQLEQRMEGSVHFSFIESPEQLREVYPDAMSEHFWEGLLAAWPGVLAALEQYMNRPAFVRLLLTKAEKGSITSYSSNEVQHKEEAETPDAAAAGSETAAEGGKQHGSDG